MEMEGAFLPPQNLEAEQAVLGCMLIEQPAIDAAIEALKPEDFYRDAHRFIFEAIVRLAKQRDPVDLISLSGALRVQDRFDVCGGLIYLQTLMETPSTAANVQYYAGIVREAAQRRALQEQGFRFARMASDTTVETADLLGQAEQAIFGITQERAGQGFCSFRSLLEEELDAADARQGTMGRMSGRATGIEEFDFKTGGLQRSDFWIIAGRPSMGKTSLGVQMAVHVALNERLPVAIFSLEMSKGQLTQRILCSGASMDLHLFRSGAINGESWVRIGEEAERLHAAPLFIDDRIDLTVLEMRAACRRLAAAQGGRLGMVLVDYLQIMQTPASGSRRDQNRAQELGEVAKGLKALAKEMEVPVVALAQVGRSVESRPNKRPMMSDLGESGQLEAHADGIAFIYRDSYYRRSEEGQREDPFARQVAEILIAKQRNGPTGTCKTGFVPAFARFEDFPADQVPDEYDAEE